MLLGISCVFFRNKPPTPPSLAQAHETGSLTEGLKACINDPNMVKLIVCFGVVLGIMTAYGTIIGIVTA